MLLMECNGNDGIALALSGGGMRAMLFHLGVLKALAEKGELESVVKISTVSGGSLLVGLIYKENNMRWPTSVEFINSVLPSLKHKFKNKSLIKGALKQLCKFRNFKYFLSRANLLALALKDDWGIVDKLGDLPSVPEWSINGTTAENGRRFRFKQDDMGDYLSGYADSRNYPLSDALAVSAAFPGLIGPIRLKNSKFNWVKATHWGAKKDEYKKIKMPSKYLHLYDGGVYDNLGLEPFFDIGTQLPKKECQGLRIIVSDAGAPLQEGFCYSNLNAIRLKRVNDIISEQSRSLRVRAFVNFLCKNKNAGGYVYIKPKAGKQVSADASFSINYPTNLNRVSFDVFDKIVSHGYNSANSYQFLE